MKLSIIAKYIVPSLLALSYLPPSYAQDDLTPGPGLFSGDSGQILLFNTSGKNKKNSTTHSHTHHTSAEHPKNLPHTSGLSEFELFKEWKSYQNTNSDSYQEFQQWIEYRQFLEQKK